MTNIRDWRTSRIARFNAEADDIRESIYTINKALDHCRFWQVSKRKRLEARADRLTAELAEVRAEARKFERKYGAIA